MKSIILTLIIASAFSLQAQAQGPKAESPAKKDQAASAPMDHSQMDHSKMDHSKMNHDSGEAHSHKDSKATAEKIGAEKLLVKVNGMVCAFCAQGIEKNFNAKEQVKSTKVDLDTMEVLITLKEGKSLSEKEIKEVVTAAGFSFVGMK